MPYLNCLPFPNRNSDSGVLYIVFMPQSVLPNLKFQTSVNFTKSEICLPNAFCHACLNQLMDELAVAQCSSFVKNHEGIPAMYFVAMFGCCSMFILMHLDGYLL